MKKNNDFTTFIVRVCVYVEREREREHIHNLSEKFEVGLYNLGRMKQGRVTKILHSTNKMAGERMSFVHQNGGFSPWPYPFKTNLRGRYTS
jgi:TFIIF-interacting CTD phosphatase-like protein